MRSDLSVLDGQHFDVLIIGGGINGASAAQHLAASGYSVALIEKNDYASAASSRSSRVLHSGLRYFAPARSLWEHVLHPRRFLGKLRSAIESMSAMGDIVGTMPERVKPMNLLMPVYRNMPYSGWHVDIGVMFLGLFKRNNVPLVYKRFPGSSPENPSICSRFRDRDDVSAFTLFRDFQFVWPERICLDAIMNAKDIGAVTRNYTTLTECQRTDDGEWRISVSDTLAPGSNATIFAKMIVNTAGVWMDGIIKHSSPVSSPKRRVIAVKGAHILVRLPDEFKGQGIASLNRENEAIFLLPWDDLHYVGPTETVYEGDLDEVYPEENDIEFLIEEANHLLPSLNLTRSGVLMAWAGVRPITYDEQYPKGRRLPFSVLHDLSEDGLPNMLALTWGTINLHRVSARNIVKAVRARIPPSGTPRKLDYSARRVPRSGPAALVFESEPSITSADLAYLAGNEDAVTLIDVLYRRTSLGWRPRIERNELGRAAEIVGSVLGWPQERIEEEIGTFISYARARHLITVE